MLSRLVPLVAILGLIAMSLRAQVVPETQNRAVVRVGVLTDNYPFSYQQNGDAPAGFVVDLLREIEVLMALNLERRTGTTGDINPAFARGEIDLLQSFAYSEAREPLADFSVPYLRMSGAIFTRPEFEDIDGIADLRGRRVLVHRGSVGEQLLHAAGLDEEIVYVDSVEQAFQWISEGRGDATLASRLTGMATIHHLGLEGVVASDTPVPGYAVRYCFAVQNGDAQLLARINEGLAILHSTGRYDAIYRRWFGRFEPARFTFEHVLLAVAGGLALALGVAIWAYVHQRTLHRQIETQAAQLRASETRLRRVFDASPEALLVVTGNATDLGACRLREANPAAQLLFGWERNPETGRSLSEIAPEQAALWSRLGASVGLEHQLAPVDGDVRWIRGARVPLETDGGHLLVLIDITEARRTAEQLLSQEKQLRQAQKLEALGTLSSGIAHDFNNILSCIIGNAQLAQMDAPPDSPVAARLDALLHASLRARELVRQILAFSRHAPPRREILPVAPIIRETLQFIRAAAPSTIELGYRQPESENLIHVDPTQLHQVLMNLCTNAVQAMQLRPGRLDIIEEGVWLDPEQRDPALADLKPGHYLRLSVCDTGPGIPPDILARIFEPFFTTKSPGEGTGLGLAVVHGIMRAHLGAVTVTSEPGVGTRFHLLFPVASASTPGAAIPEAQPGSAVQRRVMLIDDEIDIVDPAGELLRRAGCRVTAFTDPRAALREMEAHPQEYDLVICDLTMPHLTGLDVLRETRVHRPDVGFVLVSGFLGADQRREASEQGVDALVDKPLTRESLQQALTTFSRSAVS